MERICERKELRRYLLVYQMMKKRENDIREEEKLK